MNSDTAKGSFEWLLCPVCGSKTRIKMRSDTELINFPLFCPKCRKETLAVTCDYFAVFDRMADILVSSIFE